MRLKKYAAFVVPALRSSIVGNEADYVMCCIGGEDEAFPFLAMPLTRKPTLNVLQNFVGGRIETPLVAPLLKKAGYNWCYVNDDGMFNGMEFNADASAFVAGSSHLFGNAVFCRRA
jgi:hypothetical protein